jgi:hypothetical protein
MARKIRRNRRKGAQADNALRGVAAQAGIDRAEHFAKGLPLTGLNGWRAIRTVVPDARKKASRRACRARVDY